MSIEGPLWFSPTPTQAALNFLPLAGRKLHTSLSLLNAGPAEPERVVAAPLAIKKALHGKENHEL